MRRRTGALAATAACAIVSAALLQAQGRGSAEWTTSGLDAQRTRWLQSDARLTKDAVLKNQLKFLWKAQFENAPRQLNSLTEPIILDRLIGFRGFKALAFIGGSEDRLFAIDTDLGKPYWTSHLNYTANTGGPPPSSWSCPGGLIATPSRRTNLAPSALGRGGAGGRGGRSGSSVGEPGRGAAVLSQAPQGRGAGGQGRGAALAPAGPVAPPATPASPAVAPVGFGGVDPIYAMASDGFLHVVLSSTGSDAEAPVPFIPPSAKPSSLLYVDGIVYTSTSGECGAAPNAVWAMDLATKERKVATWKTGGAAGIAGSGGLALGTDGTLYVSVGADPRSTSASAGPGTSNAVVSLGRKTLDRKDWFTADGADFNASPAVIRYKDKDLVAVTANDGRLYLLDGASLGGADHKTPLHVTAKFTGQGAGTALATWEDQGTRWILATATGPAPAGRATAEKPPVTAEKPPAAAAPGNGSIVAFKLVEQNGTITLQRGWASRPLVSPLAPIVVNGIAFVASSGEYRGGGSTPLTTAERARRSTPAVLYALDAATGKELWNSGRTITSFARAGLSAGAGQVYLVTHDSTLYAFGIPMEH